MSVQADGGAGVQRVSAGWLWAEFAFLYVAIPLAIAIFLPPRMMFPALFAATALGLVLLHFTPGFRWKELLEGPVPWRVLGLFILAVTPLTLAVAWAATDGRPLAFALRNPQLMAMILVFYPIFSALPQELVFRPLYFRRYGEILPPGNVGLVANAAIFSLAHLMYWSVTVAVMTFVGGLAFAWAYRVMNSFPLAVVFHAVAGQILFLLGLGLFFYSGNVVRPF